MFRRFGALVAIFVLLSLPVSALAAETDSGTIDGQLVNRTAGGKSVADVEVELKTLVNNQETASTKIKTASDGKFIFGKLPTDSKSTYQLTFTYQEAEYTHDVGAFEQGETSKSVEVPVYDATNSDAAVKVPQAHTIIKVGQGSLEVMEVYLFANDTDRAYVGSGDITSTGKRKTLTFPLPAKKTDLQYGDGLMSCCVLPSQEGFIDTMPVMPEVRQIIFGYNVPYNGNTFTFSKPVKYPIGQYNLLVQGDGLNVASDQLATQGPLNISGVKYTYLTGQDLVGGGTITATLSGLPKASNQRAVVIWVAGALVIMAVGAALAYQRTRGKRVMQTVAAENLSGRREEKLLLEIAQLDDDFAEGRIQEEAYQSERATKKAQLVKLINAVREASGRK